MVSIESIDLGFNASSNGIFINNVTVGISIITDIIINITLTFFIYKKIEFFTLILPRDLLRRIILIKELLIKKVFDNPCQNSKNVLKYIECYKGGRLWHTTNLQKFMIYLWTMFPMRIGANMS